MQSFPKLLKLLESGQLCPVLFSPRHRSGIILCLPVYLKDSRVLTGVNIVRVALIHGRMQHVRPRRSNRGLAAGLSRGRKFLNISVHLRNSGAGTSVRLNFSGSSPLSVFSSDLDSGMACCIILCMKASD